MVAIDPKIYEAYDIPMGAGAKPSYHFNSDLEAELCIFKTFCHNSIHEASAAKLEKYADDLRIEANLDAPDNPCRDLGLGPDEMSQILTALQPDPGKLDSFYDAVSGVVLPYGETSRRDATLEALNRAGLVTYIVDISEKMVDGKAVESKRMIRFDGHGYIDHTVKLTHKGVQEIHVYRNVVFRRNRAEHALNVERMRAADREKAFQQSLDAMNVAEGWGSKWVDRLVMLLSDTEACSSFSLIRHSDAMGVAHTEAGQFLTALSACGSSTFVKKRVDPVEGSISFTIIPRRLAHALQVHMDTKAQGLADS